MSIIATYLGENSSIISIILFTDEFALTATKFIVPDDFLITSNVCVPIEPVAPKIDIFFIFASYVSNHKVYLSLLSNILVLLKSL